MKGFGQVRFNFDDMWQRVNFDAQRGVCLNRRETFLIFQIFRAGGGGGWSQQNRLVSQMQAPLAACREPAGKLWQLCKVLYVFWT